MSFDQLELRLRPTSQIVEHGGSKARLWSGTTQSGAPVVACVSAVASKSRTGQMELERALEDLSKYNLPPVADLQPVVFALVLYASAWVALTSEITGVDNSEALLGGLIAFLASMQGMPTRERWAIVRKGAAMVSELSENSSRIALLLAEIESVHSPKLEDLDQEEAPPGFR